MKNFKYFLLFIAFMHNFYINAQFSLNVQYRPRSEFRDGYSTLIAQNTDPAFFVQHRGRLSFSYNNNDFLQFKASCQDIRVWGNTPLLSTTDNNLGFHEFWVQLKMNQNWSAKIGRQEIKYDNERIFGNVDWAQAALAHDGLLLQHTSDKWTGHLGLVFNQNGVKNNTTFFELGNNYKTFQYIWLNFKPFAHMQQSILFLNNGIQVANASKDSTNTRFSQTIGTFIKLNPEKWQIEGSAYYQFGEAAFWNKNTLSAYELALEASSSLSQNIKVGVGYEILSGNKTNDNTIHAFTPFFGTNHKFNGWMDYYYVGNHINSVGLQDMYANFQWKKDAYSFNINLHQFFTAKGNDFKEGNLGNELDFSLVRLLPQNTKLVLGYSQYFKNTETEKLKNVSNPKSSQSWIWAMLDINFEAFKTEK